MAGECTESRCILLIANAAYLAQTGRGTMEQWTLPSLMKNLQVRATFYAGLIGKCNAAEIMMRLTFSMSGIRLFHPTSPRGEVSSKSARKPATRLSYYHVTQRFYERREVVQHFPTTRFIDLSQCTGLFVPGHVSPTFRVRLMIFKWRQ